MRALVWEAPRRMAMREQAQPQLSGSEVLVSRSAGETLGCLLDLGEEAAQALARRARQRVLREHTAAHRAMELEGHVAEVTGEGPIALCEISR